MEAKYLDFWANHPEYKSDAAYYTQIKSFALKHFAPYGVSPETGTALAESLGDLPPDTEKEIVKAIREAFESGKQ